MSACSSCSCRGTGIWRLPLGLLELLLYENSSEDSPPRSTSFTCPLSDMLGSRK